MADDSPFLDPNGEPRLVECAVLYFDLLGVSAMARGAGAQEELRRFDSTIRDAFPYAIGTAPEKDDGPAYPATVFSDSVVAAVPVSGGDAAAAIFQLVFDVAPLQTELASRHYFARGAITLDLFHCHDGLLFGPALVEAVTLERTVAVDPRIVVSSAAAVALIEASESGGAEDAGKAIPVRVDEDRVPFVDYLGGAFQADPEIELSEALPRHRAAVTSQLERQAGDFGRWSKLRWAAELHNETCRGYQEELEDEGGFERFLIDSVRTRRHFRPLT